jgi:hypothetical protein
MEGVDERLYLSHYASSRAISYNTAKLSFSQMLDLLGRFIKACSFNDVPLMARIVDAYDGAKKDWHGMTSADYFRRTYGGMKQDIPAEFKIISGSEDVFFWMMLHKSIKLWNLELYNVARAHLVARNRHLASFDVACTTLIAASCRKNVIVSDGTTRFITSVIKDIDGPAAVNVRDLLFEILGTPLLCSITCHVVTTTEADWCKTWPYNGMVAAAITHVVSGKLAMWAWRPICWYSCCKPPKDSQARNAILYHVIKRSGRNAPYLSKYDIDDEAKAALMNVLRKDNVLCAVSDWIC